VLLAVTPKVEQRRTLRFFTLLPGVVGIIVALVGVVSLGLHFAGIENPRTVGTERFMMTPITALTFIIAGLALKAAQKKDSRLWTWISRVIAASVGVIALFALLEYALEWNPGIDRLWFTFLPGTSPFVGWERMPINAALAFALFAQGVIFLDGDRRDDGLRSQLFATLTLIIAFISLVGYLFGVHDFLQLAVLSGMPLVSAITFTLLGGGLLFSQLRRGVPALIVDDGAAGFVARRLIPGAVFVPFVLTMLRFTGEQHLVFGTQLGASLFAVADMVVFLLLIAWSARVLRDIDRKRGELLVLEREAHEASERARVEAEIAMTQAEAARAEAESANGAKSDFLAVMSHELRTPLAAIMGYQELLADGITGPVTEAQAQQLGRIKVSARHLLSLIDEILTFTRLDAGRETVVPEPIDLDDALKDAAEIVEPLATAKKLELKTISAGPGSIVESDSTKIRQILVNLMSNAVKFTDTGSVTAEANFLGREFLLKVTDTGIGIQPENLHRIFDPFWQVEQKATRRATGTGLGLTVTKRLANLLGGDVDVTSTPGQGTTFTVRLPVKVPHIGELKLADDKPQHQKRTA
jgi:signal transduction histidine kinase